jgi:hypothetical protein
MGRIFVSIYGYAVTKFIFPVILIAAGRFAPADDVSYGLVE